MFQQESYNRHNEWYNQHFPTRDAKSEHYKRQQAAGYQTIARWLQQFFFTCLDPLLKTKDQSWLTIGDAYGFDAQYILSKGGRATATDLNTDFLEIALEEGIITGHSAQNAEKLSFPDEDFDYVLCKESYHHFPRPYAALYEMIRVAKKAAVVIEPQDPVLKMPSLLLITNLLASRIFLLNKLWKNRFSYEPVGNFVYKVSEREFEKFAAGLNLPAVAFKKINPNFYFRGAENLKADPGTGKFRMIRLKKKIADLLVKLGILPGQVLSAIIFKKIPDENTVAELKKNGYRLTSIPVNPYL